MDEYKRRRRRSRAVMSMFLDSLGGSIDNVDVATFDSDGADLKALIVGIDPVQDLHGYDNPWPAGGGKNKFNVEDETVEINGVTFTFANNVLTVVGEPIIGYPNTTFSLTEEIPAGTHTIKFLRTLNGKDNPTLRVRYKDGTYLDMVNISEATMTHDSPIIGFQVSTNTGDEYDVVVSQIQIESGSTATAWAPYSNICPISGHSSVNVIVSPTFNPLDGTITNIPLGGTCYGGQLDVLPGLLMDTNANIASYNGETINEPWISSIDAYSPGATPTIGAQVVYPLSTPQIIQLTGQQIATFPGTNNVWCSSGKIIHLEY